MKNWERIQSLRKDITSYVIHLIKSRLEHGERMEGYKYVSSFEVLKEILKDGYFKTGFSPRQSPIKRKRTITIKGSNAAVCFTEQPLNFILISNHVDSSKYPLYGIAVRKEHLYQFGGRPVIYGDETLLGRIVKKEEPTYEEGKEIYKGGFLHSDIHYLWVGYDPTLYRTRWGYTVDWTHEREWRCKAKRYNVFDVSWHIDGVPILLPDDYWDVDKMETRESPDFKILVHSREELSDLKKWIFELESYRGENKWLDAYFKKLPMARIISFEEIKEHLEAGEENWSRFENIPIKSDNDGGVGSKTC